jgi:oxygen-dependent protoporphyrinogen oxidase
MPHIGILGAGIAGLTAAYRLQQKGLSVQVLEVTDHPGGVIRSENTDGFLVEHGPNSLRPSPVLEETVQQLSLDEERVWANDAASTRYIVRDGRPLPVPSSLGAFLTTDLFSNRAKFRLLGEPFVGRRSATQESLADFVRRRLGPEVLDYAVAPFVGGVYAGDPEQLSARHAFERLSIWEEEYGSLFWGAMRSGSEESSDVDVPSGLFSFRDGIETLPRTLADVLGNRIQYESPATALQPDGATWTVTVDSSTSHSFDALICTVPLHQLDTLRLSSSVPLSPLTDVSYPPVQVVALGYPESAIAHPLDGFGMLVPPVEDNYDILGTLFSSTLFPGRAPEGHVLLTTFVGGARNPELGSRDAKAIQPIVERDLDRLLSVDGEPTFARHVHWPRAIPQYTVGYGTVKDTLSALEEEHPSLYFAGNYRQGVAVGDAMASGADAANRCATSLAS